MPTRERYQQWTRQPQFAAPLSGALRPAFVAAWDGRRNLASGRDVSTYTTSGISGTAGLYGRGLEFTGSGSGQVLHAFADAAAFSVLVVAELKGGGSSSLGRIVSTFDGANGYDLYFDGASLDYGATFVGSGRASWGYAVPSSERAAVFGVSHDASSAANTPALYINGAARSLTVNAAPSGSRVAHAGTLGIGCRPDVTTRQMQGSVYLVAAWSEALPAAVMTRLTANPWQLFAPRRLLVPVAGGTTGVSLSDSGAGTDTASTTGSTALSDSGTGTDSVSTSRNASLSDSGTGTDAVSTTGTASITDSGTGTDAISVDTGSTPISLSDSGTGTDTVSAVVSLSAGDSGAGTDTASETVALSASDSGTGTDDISVSIGNTPVSLSDSGFGTDTASAAVALGAEDSGTGTDVVGFVVKEISFSDSASGSDDIIVGKVGGSDEVGGGIAPKRRPRWVLEHRGAIYEFESQNEMRDAAAQLLLLEDRRAQQQADRAQKRRSKPQKRSEEVVSSLENVAIEVGATEAVSLATAQEMAALQGLIDSFNAAYNSRQWAQVMDVFQQARERDEEDCILLLSEFA